MRSFPIEAQLKRLLNVTQSYHPGLYTPKTYQHFLIFKAHRETKALHQAPLPPHKAYLHVAGGISFLAHSPEAFIQANTTKLHQRGKVHDSLTCQFHRDKD